MVKRGIYTEAEKQFWDNFEKQADTRVGWAKEYMGSRVVTVEHLKSVAIDKDPWNPLWRIEKYAINTRWGGLIGHPWAHDSYRPQEMMPDPVRGAGFRKFVYIGEDWEFFQPIRPGDIIRSWQKRPTMTDATSLDGNGLRKYNYIDIDAQMINQRNEIISTLVFYTEMTFHPKRPDPILIPEYGYTMEELDYLGKLIEGEEIRGAKIRYWEDVKVGDEPKPTVLGPSNLNTGNPGARPLVEGDEIPHRTPEKYEEPFSQPVMSAYIPDPVTGLLYTSVGGHFQDRAAQFEGEPRSFLGAKQSRYAMTRLLTNWMGDDGFLRKFKWRHICRTPTGDASIARGKVVKKYIENGEHLVDLKVWLIDMRSNLTEVCTATIKLLSKNDPYPDAKVLIKC